ncbi:gamma-soluble NSF attachment protein isoform X2 [Manduca sexta]|uniref:gamma-soluble NSF attachment protein isoform X2 n=1 Tax=Manduca sexta TaxID=7130 RepID=UPI0011845357|nr:gamma-soluble NSF attachment protein isoform X2 [Manduca sexta]
MSTKLQEAQEHYKVAEKCMKTSFLRWKPDYDSAADEYSQAAQCYRIARDLKNSKECHMKASECYKNNRSLFHAAKALESAMIVSKEFSTPQEVYEMATESASLYQQHGSGDSGANVLDKAGKILEENAPELAFKLFQQAADVSSEWGNNCESSEMHTIEQLLQAFDEEDREMAKKALTCPFIRSMDVEYARLAAAIPLPEAMEPIMKAGVRENAAPSYVSPTSCVTDRFEVEIEESPYEQVTYKKRQPERAPEPQDDDDEELC